LQPLVLRCLYRWAKGASEPLRTYATGILAAAVENKEVKVDHHVANAELVSWLILWLMVTSVDNFCYFAHLVYLYKINGVVCIYQTCRVARSRGFLGGVEFLRSKNTTVGVGAVIGLFNPTL